MCDESLYGYNAMKNVIIMGSGRSGTSMTAGVLAQSGYFMGHYVLNKGRINNPFGNYEDREVNYINEQLLSQVIQGPELVDGVMTHRDRPSDLQRWLGRVPVGTVIPPLMAYMGKLLELTSHKPYCFKDPRFSYTLPVWRPYLQDTVFVCVFREPHKTAQSILKQIKDAPYLKGLEMDYSMAIQVWSLMYSHILDIHRVDGEWLFLHYDQLLTNAGLDRLSVFIDAAVDRDFPKRGLRRTYYEQQIPGDTLNIYTRLCDLAGFDADYLDASVSGD